MAHTLVKMINYSIIEKTIQSKHLILIIYYENDKEKQQIHTFKKLDWALKYDSPSIKTFGNLVFNQ